TVGMLEAILQAAELDAVACGNVGLPVVDAVRAGHRVLAVELSSFQLHWSSSLAPVSGAVLNLAADHLDWHGSMEAYGAAKAKIFTGNRVAVSNADDSWSSRLAAGSGAAEQVSFTLSEPERGQLGVRDGHLVDRAFTDDAVLLPVSEVHPPGPHNLANAFAAAALARGYGVAPEAVAAGRPAVQLGAHLVEPDAAARRTTCMYDT